MSFPTCNAIHEVDLKSGIIERGYKIIGKGGSRGVWKVLDSNPSNSRDSSSACVSFQQTTTPEKKNEAMALKVLSYEEKYAEYKLEHQRIDSLATERLTSSRNVVDIFGYCGGSALNEFADGGDLRSYYKRGGRRTASSMERLLYARDIAMGLAEIHSVGIGTEPGKNLSSLIHNDLQMSNFLIVKGKLKFHDFNNAKLLLWNYELDERCGWHADKTCSALKRNFMSLPEECILWNQSTTEKVEVFRFATLLYHLIPGGYGRRYIDLNETDPIQIKNLNKPPNFPPDFEESSDPAIRALASAIKLAFTYEESKRPSARFIADFLDDQVNAFQSSVGG